MNVIVSNKYQALLSTLDIEVIKNINGEFTIQELVNQFNNFYYGKMIIDITAIKNYQNINTIRELSINFPMDKVILLLDDSQAVNSPNFISQLVSMGIYNFTKNVDNIPFLLQNPNSYKDVVSYQDLNLNTTPEVKKMGAPEPNMVKRTIGFKNVTEHAGATSLIYMMKKHLQPYYKVKAFEVNNNDFDYFNDKSLESVDFLNAQVRISDCDAEVVLVDLNDGEESLCNEVIYLIEPGIIKLNKLIRSDRKIFDKLRGKKIVLNKSVLEEKDVKDFEYESGSKVFYNIPYLDEKLDNNSDVNEFLVALGFSRLR